MGKTKYEITIEIFNGEQCTPESIYLQYNLTFSYYFCKCRFPDSKLFYLKNMIKIRGMHITHHEIRASFDHFFTF